MQVDIAEVQGHLQALKAPQSGPPDPVSKLWARHLSADMLARQAGAGSPLEASGGSSASGGQLQQRFPYYFQQYGY